MWSCCCRTGSNSTTKATTLSHAVGPSLAGQRPSTSGCLPDEAAASKEKPTMHLGSLGLPHWSTRLSLGQHQAVTSRPHISKLQQRDSSFSTLRRNRAELLLQTTQIHSLPLHRRQSRAAQVFTRQSCRLLWGPHPSLGRLSPAQVSFGPISSFDRPIWVKDSVSGYINGQCHSEITLVS